MSKPLGKQGSASAGETLFRIILSDDLALLLNSPSRGSRKYPTDSLQKGWMLSYRNELLAEEGTGFGMPILKYGRQTIFPGEAQGTRRMTGDRTEVTVTYLLDIIQRLGIKGKPKLRIPAINRTRELFSALHRRFPSLRCALDVASSAFQGILRLEPAFERIEPVGSITISYQFYHLEKRIVVQAELDSFERKGCTEIIITNEQGASFDRYRDSDVVVLQGEAIGSWDEVAAGQASLSNVSPPLTFTLNKTAGARLFRGREQRAGRLAWAGLNYVLDPSTRRFAYEIRLAEGALQ